jgi:hypothetical protein
MNVSVLVITQKGVLILVEHKQCMFYFDKFTELSKSPALSLFNISYVWPDIILFDDVDIKIAISEGVCTA